MRIARVTLEMGNTLDELRALAVAWGKLIKTEKRRDRLLRLAFNESVFVRDFHAEPGRHRERIRGLLASAAARGADVALFPACALMMRTPDGLGDYSASPSPRIVVSGTQLVSRKRHKVWDAEQEGAVVLDAGVPLVAFHGGPIRTVVDGHPCVVAISSSVRMLHEIAGIRPLAADRRRTRLIFDIGHIRYLGHYLVQTLRRAYEAVGPEDRAKAFLVLAAWRPLGSTQNDLWVQPRDGATWTVRKPGTVRWTDAFGVTRADVIHYFDV